MLASGFFGMADKRTVELAKRIAEELYGEALTTHVRPPTKKSRRAFFSFNMVAKTGLYEFVRRMIPYLRIKRTEALLQYEFLSRAAKKRHIGTEHDFWLCEMSRRLKAADPTAPGDVLARVRDDFPESGSELAWLAGYTDGDGCISLARGTKTVQMSYDAMNRVELENVSARISRLLGGISLPSLKEYKSVLSENSQWKLSLHTVTTTADLLNLLCPYLITKRVQAELALFVRATTDLLLREEAISLVQDLNHARVPLENGERFLRTHAVTEFSGP